MGDHEKAEVATGESAVGREAGTKDRGEAGADMKGFWVVQW